MSNGIIGKAKKRIRKKIIQYFASIWKEAETLYVSQEWEKTAALFGSMDVNSKICFPNTIINPSDIFIGKNFHARENFRIEAIEFYKGKTYTPRISIGNDVTFENCCHIGCINDVRIGNGVMAASKVCILDHSHGKVDALDKETAPGERELYSKGPVIIEDNVWIGENVTILSGVRIGKNSIIGANSVIVKDVAPYSVVAGAPQKTIKSL
jgi:acetyltransferase-like isoleucine patch superfamily enzyme